MRGVVLGNPDINFDRIVFGVRQATRGNGNITVGRWNTTHQAVTFTSKPDSLLNDPAEPLLKGASVPATFAAWSCRGTRTSSCLRMRGKVVVRADQTQLREKSDFGGYFGQGVGAVEEMSNLFEVNIDGSGLRQLTDSPFHADQEPTYLPNGDIVFVSDRSYFGSQCAGALEQDNMILNLYRCDPDGKNPRPLSNNKDFDRHPHVMDTGQLLFLHWEYQERHLWQTHRCGRAAPTARSPTRSSNSIFRPGPCRCARHGIFMASVNCWPSLAVITTTIRAPCSWSTIRWASIERDAMRNITPGVSGTEGGYGGVKPVAEGGVEDRGGHYMFPYPLSDRSLLVSYSYKRPDSNAGQNFSFIISTFGETRS